MGMYLLGVLTCIVLKIASDEAERQDSKRAALLRKARQPLEWR